jgi:hypothetical protein
MRRGSGANLLRIFLENPNLWTQIDGAACYYYNYQVQRGKYSYTSPEGELIEVIWEADENGE